MTPQEIATKVGQQIGTSEWAEMSQDRINKFADATGDHQFIHVNPEMAKMTPFGTTIAHGFLTLEDNTDFLYKCTAPYAPQHEQSLAWDDPEVGIEWPVADPQVSERDDSAPGFAEVTGRAG